MAALKFVHSVWDAFRAKSGLEPQLLNGLRITSASPGIVNLELGIEKQHTNRLGTVHGGTIASLVDLGGSLVVASRGLFATGVSTDLNVTYIRPGGSVSDVLRAEVTCDKLGKNLAFTSVRFTNIQGDLVARGSHTKYIATARMDPNNKVDELTSGPEYNR